MFVKSGPNTKDAALLVATLFAAAAATATSNTLDLKAATNGVPRFELEVSVDALPTLLAGQNVSLKLQDSADGLAFADLGVGFTVNGIAGTGTQLIERRFGLASTTRQYIRLVATEPAGGGDLTASSFRFQPVFWTV